MKDSKRHRRAKRIEKFILVFVPCFLIAAAVFVLVCVMINIKNQDRMQRYLTYGDSELLPAADGEGYALSYEDNIISADLQEEAPENTEEPAPVPVSFSAEDAAPEFSSPGWELRDGHYYYTDRNGAAAYGLKSIDGRLYYFDAYGRKSESLGVDISFYNGNVDWEAVKSSGIDFALIRAGGRGWGTAALFEDSLFFNCLMNAKRAGLKTGIYFYSAATSKAEAVQEAEMALDVLHGISLELPVYIDMEFSGSYPSGRQDKIATATRVELAKAFCETIAAAGYRAGIYANEDFLRVNVNAEALSEYSIWVASYTYMNELPSMSVKYDIWQFTDSAFVTGISGSCDLNAIILPEDQ